MKGHDEKRAETNKREAREAEVNEQLKMLGDAIERNDRITATLAVFVSICTPKPAMTLPSMNKCKTN